MFTLVSGVVGLVFVAAAVIFLLAFGLLIKLAALKLLAVAALKITLHGVVPHFLSGILLVMMITLLMGATLAGLAICSW